jgi:hypothetical protein
MRYLFRVIPELTCPGRASAGWFPFEENILEFINPHYFNREIAIDDAARIAQGFSGSV